MAPRGHPQQPPFPALPDGPEWTRPAREWNASDFRILKEHLKRKQWLEAAIEALGEDIPAGRLQILRRNWLPYLGSKRFSRYLIRRHREQLPDDTVNAVLATMIMAGACKEFLEPMPQAQDKPFLLSPAVREMAEQFWQLYGWSEHPPVAWEKFMGMPGNPPAPDDACQTWDELLGGPHKSLLGIFTWWLQVMLLGNPGNRDLPALSEGRLAHYVLNFNPLIAKSFVSYVRVWRAPVHVVLDPSGVGAPSPEVESTENGAGDGTDSEETEDDLVGEVGKENGEGGADASLKGAALPSEDVLAGNLRIRLPSLPGKELLVHIVETAKRYFGLKEEWLVLWKLRIGDGMEMAEIAKQNIEIGGRAHRYQISTVRRYVAEAAKALIRACHWCWLANRVLMGGAKSIYPSLDVRRELVALDHLSYLDFANSENARGLREPMAELVELIMALPKAVPDLKGDYGVFLRSVLPPNPRRAAVDLYLSGDSIPMEQVPALEAYMLLLARAGHLPEATVISGLTPKLTFARPLPARSLLLGEFGEERPWGRTWRQANDIMDDLKLNRLDGADMEGLHACALRFLTLAMQAAVVLESCSVRTRECYRLSVVLGMLRPGSEDGLPKEALHACGELAPTDDMKAGYSLAHDQFQV